MPDQTNTRGICQGLLQIRLLAALDRTFEIVKKGKLTARADATSVVSGDITVRTKRPIPAPAQ